MTGGSSSSGTGAPGPAVVAIGGGHGAAATLRALRRYAGSIRAVVSVADDGGSSGRLRADLPDLPAPGDIRRCIGALAAADSHLAGLLEHRFDAAGPLDGHAYGNLLLAALSFGLGSFADAVAEVGRMTGAVGTVLPATTVPVVLTCTPLDDPGAERVVGQVAVAQVTGRRLVEVQPADAPSPPEAAAAIMAADQVVLGPGSLFTSVVAAAIVPAVRDALRATSAQRVYVANLWSQQPEAAGFTVADHVAALRDHDLPVDVVLAHPGLVGGGDDGAGSGFGGARLVERPVADDRGRLHDPERLAAALAELVGVGVDRRP